MFIGELLIVLGLTLLNGVFSGAEIAVVSVRRTRLQQLIEEKPSGARALATLREQPERFFATVQIGITVVARPPPRSAVSRWRTTSSRSWRQSPGSGHRAEPGLARARRRARSRT